MAPTPSATLAPLFAVAFALGYGCLEATAATITLDATNNYRHELEPGVFIEHRQPFVRGTFQGISGVNVEFADGPSTAATFPGIPRIGSGFLLANAHRPVDLIAGNLPFTIRSTTTGTRYDARVTYWDGPLSDGPPVGTAPVPNNSAVSVFEITRAVPEPSALLLLAAMAAGLSLGSGRAGR